MVSPVVSDPASLTAPLDPVFVRRDLSTYVDPICSGACAFCSYVLSFLVLLVAAVVVLALQTSGVFGLKNSSSGGTALIVIPCLVLAALLIFFVYSLTPVFARGLPCTLPSPPAPMLPFTRSSLAPQRVRHVVLIVNGSSGAGLGPRIAETVALPAFAAAGITATVLRTRYAAHARDYGLTISLDGVDAVCIIGGDGSFLELVNGLLARPDLSPSSPTAPRVLPVAVALIPGGSGNSVSTDLGTLAAAEAVARVIEGVTAEMDVNVLVDGAFLARAAAYERARASAAAAAATAAAAAAAGSAAAATEAAAAPTAAAGAGVGAALGQPHYDRILADVLATNVFAREEYEAALAAAPSTSAASASASASAAAAGSGAGSHDDDEGKRLLESPFGLPLSLGDGYDLISAIVPSSAAAGAAAGAAGAAGAAAGAAGGAAGVRARARARGAGNGDGDNDDVPPPLCLFSINEASIGLIGDVGATAEACRCLGPSRYDICGLWAALKLNTIETRVSTSPPVSSSQGNGADLRASREDVRGEMITAFVNHTQHFGQGLRVAPRARLDDGLLDVTFAADATRGQLLAVFGQLPSGAHLPTTPEPAVGAAAAAAAAAAGGAASLTSADGVVKQRQVGCVRITKSRARGAVNVDGEMFPAQGALYASVLPRRIRVFIRDGALPVPGKQAKEGVKLR